MVAFIDVHRAKYGVEPICAELQIAPSSYYEQKARERDPERIPPRLKRETALRVDIRRVWHENFSVHGARKTWRQLNREQIPVARCTVERLMRAMGLRGAIRGRGSRPRSPTRRPRGRRIWSSGSSLPSGLTSCGSPILRSWQLGRGLSS
jgi:putative transposase